MGGVARCVSRYIMFIEVSVSAGCRQGYTVMRWGIDSIACIERSVKGVKRACEGITVCNTWEV